MNRAVDQAVQPTSPVPPDEIERRITEYRQTAFEHRAQPVVVYSPPDHPCPWPGCDVKIAGLRIMKLEELVGPARHAECLTEFWLGSGLVAPCPSCGNLVAYGVVGKEAVPPGQPPHLPATWHQVAEVRLSKKS